MNEIHLVLHGLAIKKHATPEAVAGVIGLDSARIRTALADLLMQGRVIEAGGKYALTPAARVALDGEYPRYYASLRGDPQFLKVCDEFERVNRRLKGLITEWQTTEVAGERVLNDHSDKEHDRRIIERLGDLHEVADQVLARLARHVSRLQRYRDKLLSALEKAEDGDIAWVSDARTESYHTVWFEMHEDLLCITGRERTE
jgi:chromosome segregation ATPase